MKNLKAIGDVVALTAPTGGVLSGGFYKIGVLFGAAIAAAAEAAPFQMKRSGLFEGVTKPGSQAWTEGAKIYWDDTAKKFTTVSTDNFAVGAAAAAVGNGAGATTGDVILIPAG